MHAKTRYSLIYLASYLMLTGIAFLLAPEFALRLLCSNRSYDAVMVRFVGLLMIGLSFFVIQMIRYQLEVLYPSTIILRSFIVVCVIWFYTLTHDPLFIVVLAVVLVGLVSTSLCLFSDRKKKGEEDSRRL